MLFRQFQLSSAPDEIQARNDQECEDGRRDHPANHGCRDAFHHIGPRSLRPHDGEQAQHDG